MHSSAYDAHHIPFHFGKWSFEFWLQCWGHSRHVCISGTYRAFLILILCTTPSSSSNFHFTVPLPLTGITLPFTPAMWFDSFGFRGCKVLKVISLVGHCCQCAIINVYDEWITIEWLVDWSLVLYQCWCHCTCVRSKYGSYYCSFVLGCNSYWTMFGWLDIVFWTVSWLGKSSLLFATCIFSYDVWFDPHTECHYCLLCSLTHLVLVIEM
jgi:hypothetical protein